MKASISERRSEIARRVVRDGHISVRDLADYFSVSTETIRKDLIYLEERNVVVKGHGDATLASAHLESPFYEREVKRKHEKNRIAERAVAMVPPNGVVLLDSGTTAGCAALLLSLQSGRTIVTNSLSAANSLTASDNQVLVVGGEIREGSRSLVGTWAVDSISSVRADIALMACDGFHTDGPAIRSYRELAVKQAMVCAASKAVLLCDSSKLSRTGMYRYNVFSDFDCLITDSGASEEEQRSLSSRISLVVV